MSDDVVAPVTDPVAEPVAEWELPGAADGFQRLWAPHRIVYIGDARERDGAQPAECPFCRAPGLDDAAGLIVHRGRTAYVVMNLYPYNTGHVMICPYRHVPLYDELGHEELIEVGELTQTAMRVLREIAGAHGFNIGMNQGSLAGAGIAAHLHQHVVPRWGGDTNFLPIIAQTRALPELLADTRGRLAEAWPKG